MKNFISSLFGREVDEERWGFGRTEGEEVIVVSEALPWREEELHPEQPSSMGSREVDGGFGAWEGESQL